MDCKNNSGNDEDDKRESATLMLDVEPFSINKYYFNRADNKKIRSIDARNWGRRVFTELANEYNQSQINWLKSKINPKKHGLDVTITSFHPIDDYFTKAGEVSAKTKDLTNIEKPLIDLLFDPKFNDREVPEGCPNLCLNDKINISIFSRKLPYLEDYVSMTVTIKIIELDELRRSVYESGDAEIEKD